MHGVHILTKDVTAQLGLVMYHTMEQCQRDITHPCINLACDCLTSVIKHKMFTPCYVFPQIALLNVQTLTQKRLTHRILNQTGFPWQKLALAGLPAVMEKSGNFKVREIWNLYQSQENIGEFHRSIGKGLLEEYRG